jgi:hypothetical protein
VTVPAIFIVGDKPGIGNIGLSRSDANDMCMERINSNPSKMVAAGNGRAQLSSTARNSSAIKLAARIDTPKRLLCFVSDSL